MPASVKVSNKILKTLEKYQTKEVITDWEIVKALWIWRTTFYNLVKKKTTSHITLRKLKEFLKSNWYDVE